MPMSFVHRRYHCETYMKDTELLQFIVCPDEVMSHFDIIFSGFFPCLPWMQATWFYTGSQLIYGLEPQRTLWTFDCIERLWDALNEFHIVS